VAGHRRTIRRAAVSFYVPGGAAPAFLKEGMHLGRRESDRLPASGISAFRIYFKSILPLNRDRVEERFVL
jgi:hypothetical protein